MPRTVLITGATDGIGLETARQLLAQGFRVIVHGRSDRRVHEAATRLRASAPADAQVDTAVADLSLMSQVKGLAARVRELTPSLDVLINNAGVYETARALTADGFERTMAVNHFAPFLLTWSLLPIITATGAGRIVTVSSVAHTAGHIDWGDLTFERNFSGYRTYAASKLANILFTFELARRLEGSGNVANCLHPGVISTKLLHKGFGDAGDTVERGARTSVYLAAADEGGRVNGGYFDDCRRVEPAAQARDAEAQEQLWRMSENLLQPWLAA